MLQKPKLMGSKSTQICKYREKWLSDYPQAEVTDKIISETKPKRAHRENELK